MAGLPLDEAWKAPAQSLAAFTPDFMEDGHQLSEPARVDPS